MIFDLQPEVLVEQAIFKIIKRGIERTISNDPEFDFSFNPDDPENSDIVFVALPIDENYRNVFTRAAKIGIGYAAMQTQQDSFIGDVSASLFVRGYARVIPFAINGEIVKRFKAGLALFLRGQKRYFSQLTNGLIMGRISPDGEIQPITNKFGDNSYKGAFITISWYGLIRQQTVYPDTIPFGPVTPEVVS